MGPVGKRVAKLSDSDVALKKVRTCSCWWWWMTMDEPQVQCDISHTLATLQDAAKHW